MDAATDVVSRAAQPLPDLNDPRFADAFDQLGSARIVLLGEASHGTSEFYRARAAITRRLIERHGFTVVAVEADWPDAATINADVRGLPAPQVEGEAFARFPTWMWRNAEIAEFTAWLKGWNRGMPAADQAGFYGLDLYNMAASIRAVIDWLDSVDPEAAREARQRYACLAPWADEPQRYGHLAVSSGFPLCKEGAVKMLKDLHARALECVGDCAGLLDAEANARLVANAEHYYRAMYDGPAESWNVRDTHMADTLDGLLRSRGPGAKAVVWAHNSHIGDARATEMGTRRGELNLGQLCRERHGEAVRLVGFGTHDGVVTCASDWDAPTETKGIRPSRPDSYERVMHDTRIDRFLLDLRRSEVRAALVEPRLQRFIGVIYRPDTERWSHYAESRLAEQYDWFVWFDRTTAVKPLDSRPARAGADDLVPTGL